jgi:hypothetical protein
VLVDRGRPLCASGSVCGSRSRDIVASIECGSRFGTGTVVTEEGRGCLVGEASLLFTPEGAS